MATKAATKTAPTKAAPTKAAPKPEPTEETPSFNWDALPDETAVQYQRGEGIVRKDLEAVTPEPIKRKVQLSYALYMGDWNTAKTLGISDEELSEIQKISGESFVNEDDARTADVKSQDLCNKRSNRKQPTASSEMAETFLKLARQYAGFRGWTLRGQAQGQTVVFRVKPKEARSPRKAA